jgi:hypothetical protein
MRDHVMQGLVRLPHIVRCEACGHGLNTFPFSRKKQTLAIEFQWFDTISVLRGLRQAIEIGRKAFFLARLAPKKWRSYRHSVGTTQPMPHMYSKTCSI